MQHCSRIIHYKLGFKNFDYHSLRHTHATMLLSAGANIKAVQERLGHKKVDLKLDSYTHVTDKMRKETLEILNKKSIFSILKLSTPLSIHKNSVDKWRTN